MDYNSLVSIIVPVYNAENYLRKCIDSILNQTYKNIEVILVDDGSTDNSALICDNYAKNYNYIRVIHQKNSGPSVARNTGIDMAFGKYIQFVDSDDTLEPSMTKFLLMSMEKDSDLTVCGYNVIKINNRNTFVKTNIPSTQGEFTFHEFTNNFGYYYQNGFFNQLWNKLYSSKLIKEYNIRFKEDLTMGEDLLFNIQYIRICRNISVISDPFYNYFKLNNKSLTWSFNQNLYEVQQMLFKEVKEFLVKNQTYKEKNKESVLINYTDSIINCLNNLLHKDNKMGSKEVKNLIRSIIFDDILRENVVYFKKGNIQKKIVGYFIENKSIMNIYIYFKIKNNFKNRLSWVFSLLKKLIRS